MSYENALGISIWEMSIPNTIDVEALKTVPSSIKENLILYGSVAWEKLIWHSNRCWSL